MASNLFIIRRWKKQKSPIKVWQIRDDSKTRADLCPLLTATIKPKCFGGASWRSGYEDDFEKFLRKPRDNVFIILCDVIFSQLLIKKILWKTHFSFFSRWWINVDWLSMRGVVIVQTSVCARLTFDEAKKEIKTRRELNWWLLGKRRVWWIFIESSCDDYKTRLVSSLCARLCARCSSWLTSRSWELP